MMDFRVFVPGRENLILPHQVKILGVGDMIIPTVSDPSKTERINNGVVLQSVGLKDDYNDEIFDSDFVRMKYKTGLLDSSEQKIGFFEVILDLQKGLFFRNIQTARRIHFSTIKVNEVCRIFSSSTNHNFETVFMNELQFRLQVTKCESVNIVQNALEYKFY